MLSVVSLAHKHKVVPYATIKAELGMDNVRHLEDLIFDTMYSGLLQGKLDQRQEVLKVQCGRAPPVGIEFKSLYGITRACLVTRDAGGKGRSYG